MTCKVEKLGNTLFCILGRGWIKRCMGNVGIAQNDHPAQSCHFDGKCMKIKTPYVGVLLTDLLDPVQSLTVDIGSQNILMTLKDNGNDWSLIINLLWIYPFSVPSIFSIRLTGIAGPIECRTRWVPTSIVVKSHWTSALDWDLWEDTKQHTLTGLQNDF